MDPEKLEIRRCYEELAPIYDVAEAPLDFLLFRRRRRELLRRVAGEVLEVAAGTGRNLPHYPGNGVGRIVASDLTPAMLRRADDRIAGAPSDVVRTVSDAEELSFPDGRFDTVVSTLTVCTFPDPVGALREMARVCRPGGRILLLEHGRSSWGWVAGLQEALHDPHFRRFRCHLTREPGALVEEAGLRVREHRRGVAGIVHLVEAAPP